jgi:BirA family biotin operon repressor/biotin-[acetyl-CoA-carboxylase] ligase
MQGERATSSPFEWQVRWVEETGSTNADLIEAARAGAPFGSVLVADHQSAGRGRLGRQWAAPPGSSLLCSMLLPPELAAGTPQRLTQAVALAAAAACTEVAGVDVSLKWPNDLLVGDRKLAGVLAESVAAQGRLSAVVVGIGLNVNWPDELPAELAGLATALNHEAGHEIDRRVLLDALLASTEATDWGALAAAYRAKLATLGRDVRVDLGSVDVVGRAVDVTASGELVVEAEGGSRHVISAGDVVHLRGV